MKIEVKKEWKRGIKDFVMSGIMIAIIMLLLAFSVGIFFSGVDVNDSVQLKAFFEFLIVSGSLFVLLCVVIGIFNAFKYTLKSRCQICNKSSYPDDKDVHIFKKKDPQAWPCVLCTNCLKKVKKEAR